MLGPLLAIGSSALWGTADFLGGSLSRRLPVFTVMLGSQSAALIALAVVVPSSGGLLAPGRYLVWGVAFGLVGVVALAAFYRALSAGTMGVVAPIAATGVAIPVLVGLADGDRPAAHQYAGMALAVVGIVLASMAGSAPDEAAEPKPWGGLQAVGLAIVAAIGFGTVMVLIERGGRTSVGMTILAARAASTIVLLLVLLRRRTYAGPWRQHLPMMTGVGLLDVGANVTIALAQQHAALSLTSVLGSMYPIVTVALARHVHAERLTRAQAAGVTAALAGVVLIASTP